MSGSAIYGVLLPLLSSVVGGLVVAFASHWMTRQRESQKQKTELRIKYLIEAWQKLERASVVGGSDPIKRDALYDGLEEAVANVLLLGTSDEVALAKQFSAELSRGPGASPIALLNALRASLRSELGLAAVDDQSLFLRMHRS